MPAHDLSSEEAIDVLANERLVRVAFLDGASSYLIPLGYVWSGSTLYGVMEPGKKTRIADSRSSHHRRSGNKLCPRCNRSLLRLRNGGKKSRRHELPRAHSKSGKSYPRSLMGGAIRQLTTPAINDCLTGSLRTHADQSVYTGICIDARWVLWLTVSGFTLAQPTVEHDKGNPPNDRRRS